MTDRRRNLLQLVIPLGAASAAISTRLPQNGLSTVVNAMPPLRGHEPEAVRLSCPESADGDDSAILIWRT